MQFRSEWRIISLFVISLATVWGQGGSRIGHLPTFKQVIGHNVENSDGQNLGTVNDLVIDMRSGKPQFIVVASGRWFGLGRSLKLAPASTITAATAKLNTFEVKIPMLAWDDQPQFSRAKLSRLIRPSGLRQREGLLAATGRPDDRGDRDRVTPVSQPQRSPRPAPRVHPKWLRLAGDCIGRQIVNRQNENLGQITDLVLDPTGARPGFALVQADWVPGRRTTYAVPLQRLSPRARDRKFELDATRTLFEQAQEFDFGGWRRQSVAHTQQSIYRFAEADNRS